MLCLNNKPLQKAIMWNFTKKGDHPITVTISLQWPPHKCEHFINVTIVSLWCACDFNWMFIETLIFISIENLTMKCIILIRFQLWPWQSCIFSMTTNHYCYSSCNHMVKLIETILAKCQKFIEKFMKPFFYTKANIYF